MRIVLVGTVRSTQVALEVMSQRSYNPSLLITLPLSKAYRHSDFVDLRPLALKYNVPLLETTNINDVEVMKHLKELKPEYIFVIGWSQILSKELLTIPSKGCIGYHPAPLPRNRGRAVIPWTILLEEKETGSTLFWLDEGVDSGDILIQKVFPVTPFETATTLYEKHLKALEELLLEALYLFESNKAPRIPQDHTKATYCAKRTPEDGFINWELPAKKIETLIRAVTRPYPGAFTFYKSKKIIIWEAEYMENNTYYGLPGQIQKISSDGIIVTCGDEGTLLLKEMEIEGENKLNLMDFFKVHEKFGINILELYRRYLALEVKDVGR